MKKKLCAVLLSALVVTTLFAGCGGNGGEASSESGSDATVSWDELTSEEQSSIQQEEIINDEAPREGMYRSELTNEWIDESLKDQRPVAIMVDNEKTALDHYGMTQADIVYEMMNSTANGEVTRFMAIVKDWESITRFGSIRSIRPTNFMIAPEYNAILIHDGGPFYIDPYLGNPWIDNLSGGFARIENGKPREFTEYVTTGEIAKRIEANNIDREYNSYYEGAHFQFASKANPVKLESKSDAQACSLVDLPFPHNGSELEYDPASNTYLYYEYGMAHVDPENDNKQLAFTNVIIQSAVCEQFDENGYMQFNLLNKSGNGWYITGGQAIPITWQKGMDTSPTKYYDSEGKELTLNTGKTYIALVSQTRWGELVLK